MSEKLGADQRMASRRAAREWSERMYRARTREDKLHVAAEIIANLKTYLTGVKHEPQSRDGDLV